MPALVSVEQVATALGIDMRSVQRLVSKKILPKEAHGKYSLGKVMHAYIQYQKNQKEKAEGGNEAGGPNEYERGIQEERRRDLKASADLKELELKKALGQLLPLEVYGQEMSQHILQTKQRLLQLPQRVAPSCEMQSRAEVKRLLTEAIYEVLEAMSGNRDLPAITAGNQEGPDPQERGAADVMGTAPENQDQRVGGSAPHSAQGR